jgi:hypothetical protein
VDIDNNPFAITDGEIGSRVPMRLPVTGYYDRRTLDSIIEDAGLEPRLRSLAKLCREEYDRGIAEIKNGTYPGMCVAPTDQGHPELSLIMEWWLVGNVENLWDTEQRRWQETA